MLTKFRLSLGVLELPPTSLNQNPSPGWAILLRPRWLQYKQAGTGILTCLPSPTPCGLGLGPTNPERINLAQETLGLRRAGFSPALSLLMSASALPEAPHVLTVMLQRR